MLHQPIKIDVSRPHLVSLLLGNDCYDVLEEFFHGLELPVGPPGNAKFPATFFQCCDAYTQTPRCLINGKVIQSFQGLPRYFRAPAKGVTQVSVMSSITAL